MLASNAIQTGYLRAFGAGGAGGGGAHDIGAPEAMVASFPYKPPPARSPSMVNQYIWRRWWWKFRGPLVAGAAGGAGGGVTVIGTTAINITGRSWLQAVAAAKAMRPGPTGARR